MIESDLKLVLMGGMMKPYKELLDIFKEHHVDIITASDAHKPADVGTCIKDVYKLCQYD